VSENNMVGVDSNVIVWGVRDASRPSRSKRDKDKSKQCEWLFWDLNQTKAQLYISAVSVSEVLRGIQGAEKQRQFVEELQRFFIIAPLDTKASVWAGKIWQERAKSMSAKDVRNAKVKADMLIVASLKSMGVSAFYSDDAGARKIAALVMNAFPLPTHSPTLFELPEEDE